jgi:hypothetical protein
VKKSPETGHEVLKKLNQSLLNLALYPLTINIQYGADKKNHTSFHSGKRNPGDK